MANKGLVDQYVNGLPSDIRYAIRQIIWYLMDNFRIGVRSRAENGSWYRFTATTPTTANQEFLVTHSLGVIPTQAIPLLDLGSSGQQLVSVKSTRPADMSHLYLSSPSTGASITLLVEV